MINEFITLFMNLNNREPTESEIIDNLKEKMNVENGRATLVTQFTRTRHLTLPVHF